MQGLEPALPVNNTYKQKTRGDERSVLFLLTCNSIILMEKIHIESTENVEYFFKLLLRKSVPLYKDGNDSS